MLTTSLPSRFLRAVQERLAPAPVDHLAPAAAKGASGPGGTADIVVRKSEGRVTVACGCGRYSLSFFSIAVARRGRFRCPICGTQEEMCRLIEADGAPLKAVKRRKIP